MVVPVRHRDTDQAPQEPSVNQQLAKLLDLPVVVSCGGLHEAPDEKHHQIAGRSVAPRGHSSWVGGVATLLCFPLPARLLRSRRHRERLGLGLVRDPLDR